MKLGLSEEQKLLQEAFAKFFSAESTPAKVRAAEPLGFDAALWKGLVDMGAPAMRAAEEPGGDAASLLDAVLVAEEAGRHLASAPLIETMTAARLLADVGGEIALAWLNRIRSGEAMIVPALHPVETNRTQLVPGAAVADAVLYLEGDAVKLLAQKPPREAPPNLASGPILRMRLAEGETIARGPKAASAYRAAVEEWKILTAAMLAGIARRGMELAAEYSRERMQFGQPIGSFQGVAHPLADSAADIEGAALLVRRAVWAIAKGREDAAASVAMAFWWASHAAARALTRSVRTFGGYGLTLEYDIQLYYRRGKAAPLPLGDPRLSLLDVADRLWRSARPPLPDAGAVDIEFGFGEKAEKFEKDVRRFFEDNMTPALRAKAHHSTDGHDPDFHHKLAEAGYLYPDWPVEHGGQARTRYEVSALTRVFEEFNWTRVPIGTTNMGARMAMLFGSDELKREALPKFAHGEALSCLGFSEPGAGSDVFGARTRATRDGDDWIINGQKMFTTGAHISQYVLLLTRTDPEAKKRDGLTLFLMPLDLPGVAIQAVHTLLDERTNITFYDNVRVPDRYRLGEVNRGIEVMAAALMLEHGGEGYFVSQLSLLREATAWALASPGGNRPAPIESEEVRARMARVAVHTEISDLLCRQAVWAAVEGAPGRAYGPMSKLFSTNSYLEDSADLVELAAPDSLLKSDHGIGRIELAARHSLGPTIYGGTSEVHRSIIAEQALGMPRTRN